MFSHCIPVTILKESTPVILNELAITKKRKQQGPCCQMGWHSYPRVHSCSSCLNTKDAPAWPLEVTHHAISNTYAIKKVLILHSGLTSQPESELWISLLLHYVAPSASPNLPSFATLAHAAESSSHFIDSHDSLPPQSIAEQTWLPRSFAVWRAYISCSFTQPRSEAAKVGLDLADNTKGNFDHTHQTVFFTQS